MPRPTPENLPNFLLVGAARSGTTSLYNYLRQHPDIFLSNPKEPHFLVADRVREAITDVVTDFDDYRHLFDGGTGKRIRGEASVLYLYYYEDAIARIRACLGRDVRIAMVLRNPVDRAFSAYQYMARYQDREDADSFGEALDRETRRRQEGRVNPLMYYRALSAYGDAVEAYLDAFDHVHVMLHDDLLAAPGEVLGALMEFLGLERGFQFDTGARHNASGWMWAHPWIKALVNRPWPPRVAFMAAKKHLPGLYRPVRRVARRVLSRRESLDPETRDALLRYFEPDIKRLASLIGRDLGHWLQPAGAGRA